MRTKRFFSYQENKNCTRICNHGRIATNHVLALLLTLFIFSAKANAQFDRLEKYPNVPADYNGAFMDCVSGYVSGVVKSIYGQYFGQITREGDIYGYGTFYTDQDGEVFGQFRKGNLIFGIKMGSQTAKVGSSDHFIAYDLYTGDALYIQKNGKRYELSADFKDNNHFVAINYKNGDKYIGETVKGQRDGYGIYYYTNGNYYYGQYKNNNRDGYGAMFKTDNNITLQFWDTSTNDEDE